MGGSPIWIVGCLTGVLFLSLTLFAQEASETGPVRARVSDLAPLDSPQVPTTESETDIESDEDFPLLLDPDALEAFAQTPVVTPSLTQVVTTVARQESTVGRSPAAIFVVTDEMIRRSGARSLPEILRLVPGLQVARIDANKWAVTSRGFGGRFANKLLVQIDGRTVYTPLFAGTFWEIQDVLLDDIERIEVIRGPGATVWGANAVNGIINVITKSAADTHGRFAEAGGGTEERGFAGGRIGSVTEGGVHWRVSGKAFERDGQLPLAPSSSFDDYRQGRVSGRMDWEKDCDTYTLQGDYYQGTNGTGGSHPVLGTYILDEPVSGGNVLFRWTRTESEDADTTVQIFYDRTDRETLFFDQNINIFDIDYQRRRRLGCYHNVISGIGYRRTWDELPSTLTPIAPVAASPTSRTTELISAFIQDEMTLIEDEWYFTIGTKLEDNAYSDFEVQPSARLLWVKDPRTVMWGAVSRAVRTPSRVEDNGILAVGLAPGNIPITFVGQGSMQSENVVSYEIGMRQEPRQGFSWDLALFWNEYDDLVTTTPLTFFPSPPAPSGTLASALITNGLSAESYGLELSTALQLTDQWQIVAWYSLVKVHGVADPGARNQAFVMSTWDIGCDVEFDLMARYVDNVPNVATATGGVPHYLSMDLRLAWRPNCRTEWSVVGQNLLDAAHPEFGSNQFTGDALTEIQRGVYGMVRWDY